MALEQTLDTEIYQLEYVHRFCKDHDIYWTYPIPEGIQAVKR